MARTLEELIELQRAAVRARRRAEELREALGQPAVEPWTETQATTYETAWRAWRDLDRDTTDAITQYAKHENLDRSFVERTVRDREENSREEGL